MSVEKLKQAMQLLQECIDEYQGEETDEGENNEGDMVDNSSPDMSGGDKIKMAAAMMRKRG